MSLKLVAMQLCNALHFALLSKQKSVIVTFFGMGGVIDISDNLKYVDWRNNPIVHI